MKKNKIKILPSLKRKIFLIYMIGCGLWPIIWYNCNGFKIMNQIQLLWVPFLSPFVILLSNLFLWRGVVGYKDYMVELTAIEFVERNSSYVSSAIYGVIVMASAILAVKNTIFLPKEFIIFESLAFIFVVVGTFPLYWIPAKKVRWLVLLRHLKTVPFTYSIAFFLSGLLTLLHWL